MNNVKHTEEEATEGDQDGCLEMLNHPTSKGDLNDEESQIGAVESVEPKKHSWKEVFFLGFSSLGAIYGDLGTSPLYVLNSIKFPNVQPTDDDIYGAVSVIFYIFTIIVIIKYVLIVLFVGPNNGEGGQVAIYAKIARTMRFEPKGVTIPGTPEVSDLELLSRQDTSRSFMSNPNLLGTSELKNNPTLVKIIAKVVLFCCFFGCSLVVSDGLLTPTTSVLSAISGIKVAQPSFDNVLVVSEIVLIFLFAIQQFGSHKISFIFAPIIFLWLIGLFVSGIINIINFHPQIFKALSPYYAINLLRNVGIDALGGAMLAVTGTEAMFADIGHFGRLPIQLALTCFVYPILMICYLGQGAYLIKHPDAIANPFFLSIPGGTGGGFYWILFVLATLSTIIASQALILGVFSIISQLIHLDCFPNFKIIHVSKDYYGRVYIPTINWLLMIGVCLTTAGFKTSNNVTAAYGLGIAFDFLITSCLIVICMIYVYNWNIIIPICFIMLIMPLEFVLVIANLKKFMHGAWFPLLMSAIIFIFLSFWRWARSKAVEQTFDARIKIGDLYPSLNKTIKNDTLDLNDKPRNNINDSSSDIVEFGISLPKILKSATALKANSVFGCLDTKRQEGAAILYSSSSRHLLGSPNTVPQIYGKLISSFASIPTVFIFCSVRVLSIPVVPTDERILIASMKIPGHYRCVVRFGFMEEIKLDSDMTDRILSSIPDVERLLQTLKNKDGSRIVKASDIPILHIFEKNLTLSHNYLDERFKTMNPFIMAARITRRFLIDRIYSPINSVLEFCEKTVKIDDERDETTKKLIIGEVVRI